MNEAFLVKAAAFADSINASFQQDGEISAEQMAKLLSYCAYICFEEPLQHLPMPIQIAEKQIRQILKVTHGTIEFDANKPVPATFTGLNLDSQSCKSQDRLLTHLWADEAGFKYEHDTSPLHADLPEFLAEGFDSLSSRFTEEELRLTFPPTTNVGDDTPYVFDETEPEIHYSLAGRNEEHTLEQAACCLIHVIAEYERVYGRTLDLPIQGFRQPAAISPPTIR